MQINIDFIYPVGSYYETSYTSFDPNKAWGGTWVEDTWGRVTVAYQSDNDNFKPVGKVGGEIAHQLTVNEMPSHNHIWASYAGNIPGGAGYTTGIFNAISNLARTSYTNNTGGNQSHNNLQPYIVVKRWHRTA